MSVETRPEAATSMTRLRARGASAPLAALQHAPGHGANRLPTEQAVPATLVAVG